MSNNTNLSIRTRNGVEAHVVERINDDWGSLAALYDQAWLSQDPHSVFKLEPVVRDAERRISEPIPEQACILEWRFGNDVPSILRSPYECRSVYVRNEYRKMLSSIFSHFSEGFGGAAGYKHDISKSTANTEAFPPHNPFENLDIKTIEVDLLNAGVIVTGAPGIGKSVFLLYVLALRLLARQTTVLQFEPDEFLIFEEAGVFTCRTMNHSLPFLPEHTWFLVDSNRDNKEPPTSFLNACVAYSRKLIMAASPRKDRFTFLSKYEDYVLLWMQGFLKEEIVTIRGCRWGKSFLKEHQLGYFFDEFGPDVRSAFRYSDNPDSYREWIKAKLSDMHWESFRDMARKLSSGYFETDFSHRIFIAEPSNESRCDFRVEFASKSVAKLVLETYAKAEHGKSLELLRFFLGRPKARGSAGNLLEVMVEKDMLDGGAFRLSEMKRVLKRKSQQNDQQAAVWEHDPDSKPYTLLIGDQNCPANIVEGDHSARPAGEFRKVKRVAVRHGDIKTSKEDAMFVPHDRYPGFDFWFCCSKHNHIVPIRVTCQINSHKLHSNGFDWYDDEAKRVDVVIVSEEDGGKKVETAAKNARKIDRVFRLVTVM